MKTRGAHTYDEMLQQPDLWPDTVERARVWPCQTVLDQGPVVVTGAGTSAYAAAAIEAAWPAARAIPSTDLLPDLLPDCRAYFDAGGSLLSLARSGDSPESLGVIELVRRLHPAVDHFAITCHAAGGLARALGPSALLLDPRTNDRSLVMTSSFSNLVLAGLCLKHSAILQASVPGIAAKVQEAFPELEANAAAIARTDTTRVVVLASRPLAGLAREACLKILEMTAGRITALPETCLGLRHGPMSFLRPDTLVLCWLANHATRRRYEEDLLAELRAKSLGRIVAIGTPLAAAQIADIALPASAPDLPDELRTPFEIVFAQLLAFHFSLRAGLDPDSPSPEGVITRVVEGVRLHA